MPSIQSLREGYGLGALTDDEIKSFAEQNGMSVWDDKSQTVLSTHPEIIGTLVILVLAAWVIAFRKIKSKQTLVLVSLVVIIISMFVFPPFQIQLKGTEVNMGYALIFDPPRKGDSTASINVLLLMAEWFCALIVGGLLWVLAKNKQG